ncbi:MAG: hypothetical protein J3K34DRAFT_504747 [Monoraphidium minutum]|nr:MAG: hypothetical protein J3K34DRAFT_504747 [Monoraphidium minutum]
MQGLLRGPTLLGQLPARGGAARAAAAAGVHAVACAAAAAARRRPCRAPRLGPPPAAGAAAAPGDDAAAANNKPPQQQGQGQGRRLAWLPGKEAQALLVGTWQLLRANLAAVVVIHAIKEGVVFVLHRVTQRVTNAVAEGALGTQLPPFANPWYLFMEPKFVEVNWGYQVVVALFFLFTLPVNILFNSAASSTAALVCTGRHRLTDGPAPAPASGAAGAAAGGGSGSGGAVPKKRKGRPKAPAAPPLPAVPCAAAGGVSYAAGGGAPGAGRVGAAEFAGGAEFRAARAAAQLLRAPPPLAGAGPVAQLRAGLREARRGWRAAAPSLRRVWGADLLFNAWSLPLQAASLLVAPVFWTLPRLLAIQLAVPAAVLSGAGPAVALSRSKQLMAGHLAAYAWPYLFLTLVGRGADALKQVVLMSVPERYWREVIEVPLAASAAFVVLKVLLLRMQDLLPLAAYLRLAQEEGRRGGGGGGEAEAARRRGGGGGAAEGG